MIEIVLLIAVVALVAIGLLILRATNKGATSLDQEALTKAIATATGEAIESLTPKIAGAIDVTGIIQFVEEMQRGDSQAALAKLKQLPEIHRVAATAYYSEQLRVAHAGASKHLGRMILKYGANNPSTEVAQASVDYINRLLSELASVSKETSSV